MSDFELLMYEISRLPDVVHRQKVVDVMRMFVGCRLRIDGRVLRRLERDRIVTGMLDMGMSRTGASEALQQRLGISTWTAYRAIDRVLKLRASAAKR